MAELNLRPDLVRRIQEIAQSENRPVDEVVERLLTQYIPGGTPHSEAEQSTIQSYPNPLQRMLEIMESDTTIEWRDLGNTSENTKEILNTEYKDYLLARQNRPSEPNNDQNPG
jgi:hypothetical protein